MGNFKEALKNIKAFVFDVDGVFSVQLYLTSEGRFTRTMNAKDGYAVKLANDAGFKIGIITGGKEESIVKRFKGLGLSDIYLDSRDKAEDLDDFMFKYGLKEEEVLYMGDDLPDYGAMKKAGMATCPADAAEEIQGIAYYISDKKGGNGCVRDVIEQVMRVQGTWPKFKKD